MLHASVLCGSSGLENTLQRLAIPRATLAGLGAKTTVLLFRSREHATLGVTYPTLPAADNMTRAVLFQALGAYLRQLMIVFREMSFGGGAWILAAIAKDGWRGPTRTTLITVGRIVIALAAIFFGIQHFLHPLGLPGVPLEREMPAWVPGRALIDYVTGAALLIAGASILLNRKTRTVAACVGGWILLTILVIYIPLMIGALSDPNIGVEIEGINYFADTLLFAGVILAAASAATQSRTERSASD